MNACIIDGHNDHFMRKYSLGKPLHFMRVNRRFHSDGPRLLEAGVSASLFMVGDDDLAVSLSLIEQVHREVERNPEKLMFVKTTSDISTAHRTGRLGIMLILEGGECLNSSMDILRLYYRLGVRSITLSHGQGGTQHALQGTPSYFGYCTAADRDSFRRTMRGLTPFGRDVVREMNRLGMLVDLAHINDKAFFEAIELSTKPVVSTHGGVFALSPHSRCLTDEQLRAIARKNGLLGVAFYHKFISRRGANLDKLIDEVAYVADLVGIEHVGIGSDFDGLPEGVRPIIPSADRLPEFVEAMERRRFSESDIKKVLGGNFMRVLKETVG